MAGLAGRSSRLCTPQINAPAANFMIQVGVAINASQFGAIGRQMHILVKGRSCRIQAQITTFGPIAATGGGVTAQARFIGWRVNGSCQTHHRGSGWHFAIIRFNHVIPLTVHLAKDIGFRFPVHIGDSLGIGRISNEFSLIGIVVAHQTVDILGLRGVRRVAIGSDMTGKARVF